MLLSHLILAMAWIAYCVLHSILASAVVKLWLQKRMKNSFGYYRVIYTIFSFLGLSGIIIYQYSMQSQFLFDPPIFLRSIGYLLLVGGATIMLMMIWKYFMQLSGVRWLTRQESKSKLEVSGLHRLVRHPLYLGTFLFIWGWFILSPSISFLISNCIITAYTLIALKFEEQKLIQAFGDEYIQYRKKVPSIIPKI